MEELLNEDNLHSLSELENTDGLDISGLYAIKLKTGATLPESFRGKEKQILFTSEKDRIFVKGFIRNVEAEVTELFSEELARYLGYLPPKGSLIKESNQNNYKFSDRCEKPIVKWMNENLEFSFVAIVEEICIKEKCLKGHINLF